MNISRRQVLETQDFRRVFELPRRTSQDWQVVARELTAILRVEGRCSGDHLPPVKGLCAVCQQPMALLPVQAQALYEFSKVGGLFAPIRVGGGKTLLSLLAPFIVDARKPILLIPASLRDKTEIARISLSKHWRIKQNIRVMTYESLGLETKAHELTFHNPDLVIGDEAHFLKNKKAGRTRRMVRFMRENPRTKKAWEPAQRPKCLWMSGTMMGDGSIKSFAHLLQWSHREQAPVPLEEGELQEWAEAIDESTNFTRPHPGPMLKFAAEEDRVPGDDVATARRAFRRRLLETPGVVSTAGEQVANCSIYIKGIVYKPNAITEENFKILRGNGTKEFPGWITPDGWPLSMASEVWSIARQLALGFHGVWDPRPPADWLNARKDWAVFVRNFLSRSRTFDTEGQVQTICSKGGFFDDRKRWHEVPTDAYRAWEAVRDTFRINPKDVWHDTTALEECEKWMKQGPGIVWVKHVFFGEELERRTGAPYFRQGGLDRKGMNLEALSNQVKAKQAKAGPIIASIDACQAGFNLQPWNRNLITCPPSSAKAIEQLIGRTHREHQYADQVDVDILIGCIENFESWEKCKARAQMAVDTLGDSQKILIADVMMPSEWELTRQGGPRWTKTIQRKDDDGP